MIVTTRAKSRCAEITNPPYLPEICRQRAADDLRNSPCGFPAAAIEIPSGRGKSERTGSLGRIRPGDRDRPRRFPVGVFFDQAEDVVMRDVSMSGTTSLAGSTKPDAEVGWGAAHHPYKERFMRLHVICARDVKDSSIRRVMSAGCVRRELIHEPRSTGQSLFRRVVTELKVLHEPC